MIDNNFGIACREYKYTKKIEESIEEAGDGTMVYSGIPLGKRNWMTSRQPVIFLRGILFLSQILTMAVWTFKRFISEFKSRSIRI